MKDWEEDEIFAEQLESRLATGQYNIVFSINFNPIISEVCEMHHIAYRAWVYDSPIHIRNLTPLKIHIPKHISLTGDRCWNTRKMVLQRSIFHWRQT